MNYDDWQGMKARYTGIYAQLEDITEQLEELRNTVQAITAIQTDMIRRDALHVRERHVGPPRRTQPNGGA